MVITTLSADSICKSQVIAIGRQMENEYRQIIFDCSGFGPDITSITLVHQRSQDTAPYIVGTFNSNPFVWTIDDTDTAYYGYGKGELRISFADGLAKSIVFTTLTVKSITADTVIPEPLQSWYDAMIEYIDDHSVSPEELDQAIADYIEQHPIEAPVTSVNSKTGAVVLTASDVGALPDTTTASDLGAYVKPTGGIPVSDLNTTAKSRLMPTGGTTGQVLAKASGTNYDVEWINQSGGGGAVDSVNGQTGVVVLGADDVGALPDTTTAADLGAYVLPTGGIPKTDLASDVQTSLGKADTALQSAPVTSVNSKTGAVTLTASDVGALSSSTTFVSSFNGSSGAVTYTAPVTSVNGSTGAVVINNATTSAAGLMSATDKSHLDDVYADYSSALTALGVI